MAKFLIKIDRKTVKRSKEAGATSIRVPTYIKIEFQIKGRHVQPDIKFKQYHIQLINIQFKDSFVSSPEDEPTLLKTYTFTAPHNEDLNVIFDKLKKAYKKKLLNFNVRYESEQIDLSMPIPSFAYQYKKTKVQCHNCKTKFIHDELETDYDYYGDGSDCYYENICPKCGTYECCELVFEDLKYEQLAKIAERKSV